MSDNVLSYIVMKKKPLIIFVTYKGRDVSTIKTESITAAKKTLRGIGVKVSNSSLACLEEGSATFRCRNYSYEVQELPE